MCIEERRWNAVEWIHLAWIGENMLELGKSVMK
jgi:hypothetical protein